jgi:hypothetical protein
MALSIGTGWAAAPLSSGEAGDGQARSSAAGVPGVVVLSESRSQGGDGADASWTPINVGGQSVIEFGPSGWSGAAAPAGAVIDTINRTTCPSGGLRVPAGGDEAAVCAHVMASAAQVNDGSAWSYGDYAELYATYGDLGMLVTVLESHASSDSQCGDAAMGAPVVVLFGTPAPVNVLTPLGRTLLGECFGG